MANYKAMREAMRGPSKFFKPVDGENKIRIVSEPILTWKSFDEVSGTSTVYLTKDHASLDDQAKARSQMYILNRDAGSKLQIAEFGKTIMEQFFELQEGSETKFDSLPSYDMILRKTGNKLTTKYTLLPSRQNTDLKPEELKAISEAEPIISQLLSDDAVVDKDAYNAQAECDRLDQEYQQMTKS